jgi:hypothetical protein
MNDISALFAQDDATFPLEFPGVNGLVWQIRSIKNPDSEAVAKRARLAMVGGRLSGGKEINPEQLGEIALMQAGTDPSDEQLAYCVTSWEWGENTLADFDLTYSHSNVLAIIKSVPRIRAMVLKKVIEITDFT